MSEVLYLERPATPWIDATKIPLRWVKFIRWLLAGIALVMVLATFQVAFESGGGGAIQRVPVFALMASLFLVPFWIVMRHFRGIEISLVPIVVTDAGVDLPITGWARF